MFYVVAKCNADRAVLVGGQESGRTNTLLPVGEGFHIVRVDDPTAAPPEANVTGGTAVSPTIVEFTVS